MLKKEKIKKEERKKNEYCTQPLMRSALFKKRYHKDIWMVNNVKCMTNLLMGVSSYETFKNFPYMFDF